MNSTQESHAARDGHASAPAGHPDIASPGSLPHSNINVGQVERIASAVGGAALVLAGLRRGSLSGTLLALAGGGLVYRAVSGRCMLYEALGVSTAACPASSALCRVKDEIAREAREALDDSDEASFDSFPASDPPSRSGAGH